MSVLSLSKIAHIYRMIVTGVVGVTFEVSAHTLGNARNVEPRPQAATGKADPASAKSRRSVAVLLAPIPF
jgi:hypothetical protein